MKLRKRVWQVLLHIVLISGAILFLMPLIWMLSTATKPLEQTMSMPPNFVPYRSYVMEDGQQKEVKEWSTIDEPSYVLEEENGRRFTYAKRSGLIKFADNKEEAGLFEGQKVKVVQKVNASKEKPFVVVWDVGDKYGETIKAIAKEKIKRTASPRWENFGEAINQMEHFPDYLMNTLTLCVLTVIGSVFSCSLVAYGFSRINWMGRDKMFIVVLATMMIPFPVVMVPLYSLFKEFGWIGSLKPLWVPTFFAGAFNVFLLRQFFMSIPKDLSDAARVDGCSEWRIYLQIILPLAKPALMVVALFQFMATWNDFLGPLLFLTDQEDFTLALGLQFFQSKHGGTPWHYLMAASSLIVLPVIVLFFFTQKTFIEGISMSGLKG